MKETEQKLKSIEDEIKKRDDKEKAIQDQEDAIRDAISRQKAIDYLTRDDPEDYDIPFPEYEEKK